MFKFVVAAAIVATLVVAPFASRPTQAAPLPATTALNEAAKSIDVTAKARCGLAWRCSDYGCGYRTVCWAPTYPAYRHGYYQSYGYYRPYSYYQTSYPPYRYYRPYRAYRPWY